MAHTKEKLLEDIECEGFCNALLHYDDYSDIPDGKFQDLYWNFLTANKALREYLGVSEGA